MTTAGEGRSKAVKIYLFHTDCRASFPVYYIGNHVFFSHQGCTSSPNISLLTIKTIIFAKSVLPTRMAINSIKLKAAANLNAKVPIYNVEGDIGMIGDI